MNKQRLEQILQILVMPYNEPEFLVPQSDFIKAYRYAYWSLKHAKTNLESEKAEKTYYLAKKTISKFFREHAEYRAKNIDDIELLLEMFFPEEAIASQMDSIPYEIGNTSNCVDWEYYNNIFRMAESLLTFRDGKIALRTWRNMDNDIFDYPYVFDKAEIWNQLSRLITVDLIVAAYYVLCDLKEEKYLFNQSTNVMLADKTLEKILQKGVAETHLHFNAGVDFQFLWQHRMNPWSWLDENKRKSFLEEQVEDKCGLPVMVYRLCWAEYLENRAEDGFYLYTKTRFRDEWNLINELFQRMKTGNLTETEEATESSWKYYRIFLDNIAINYKRNFTVFKSGNESDTDDYLLETVFRKYKHLHISGELLLLFKSLWYFRYYENSKVNRDEELKLFLQYVRCKNIFFSSIVRLWMIEGLSSFRIVYSNLSRRFMSVGNVEKRFNVIFKSLSQSIYLKKLEVRITPPINIQKRYGVDALKNHNVINAIEREYLHSIRDVLKTFRNSMLESGGINPDVYEELRKGEGLQVPSHLNKTKQTLDIYFAESRLSLPTIGIVFHFLKQNYIGNRVGNRCWINEDNIGTSSFQNTITMRKEMITSAEVLENMRSSIPLLADYVVGLDAASEENAAEPWVFAPVYKAIRQKSITKPLVQDGEGDIRRVNNLGFTYHVGEEFRHILSGLRHVDEVVNEFQFKAGDRLGHAISLGVDIDYWVERNEAVIIPLQEYMEDLLWLWGKRVYHNWNMFFDVDALEGQVLDYVKSVLGDVSGLTIPVLYEAYKMKFEKDYDRIFDETRMLIAKKPKDSFPMNITKGHFCRLYSKDSPYGLMWTSRKIFCTFFCPAYYSLYNHPILVHVDKNKAELFKAIQKAVAKEVEQRGIYIETNPTSNLSIGELNSLQDISIMKLNARELYDEQRLAYEILATVNSDNPVIFNTNCENEHAYVYHALTSYGFPKERVLHWIDKIRQMGLDSSFIKNIKKPSQQLTEIDKLIDILDGEMMRMPW